MYWHNVSRETEIFVTDWLTSSKCWPVSPETLSVCPKSTEKQVQVLVQTLIEAFEATCLGRWCRCWCSCAIMPNSYRDWALRTSYIALLITALQSWKECHNNTFLKGRRGILIISIIAISVWQTVKTHSHSFCTQCYRASGMVQSLYLWTRDQRPKVQTDKHAQRHNQKKKEKGKKRTLLTFKWQD